MANADRIIELLHEAKARPAGAEREQFLTEACRDDAALKEQIVSLLQADAGDGHSDFLKINQILRPQILPTEKPGDRIGRYKLLEQIGEGGCGVVYMAEQQEPVRRRVALKVIKLGMDTKQVIARFEAERQALAMMDHPNIAKIFDAGVTGVPVAAGVSPAVEPGVPPGGKDADNSKRAASSAAGPGGKMPPSTAGETPAATLSAGRPFFVMELVRGIKITDYCDQNNLSTHERLELFIQVCQAIQHAHQKGIIHRDIKPSNILVTHHDDVAVPKVIDFGIAKATTGQLTDKTVFTAFAQFIGTPAYMSPEQAQMSGLDIDTRADIYSLGVLLYELLTGHTPFDAKELLAAGMDEMRRKIREDEPAKPSTCLSTMQAMDLTTVAKRRHVEPPKLIHLIRGDLDWLVMKCLEKDRTRRYETANGLAVDIQRHLSSEPVVACPPSRSYRFQKFVRRNRVPFAAVSAVILVLLAGVSISIYLLIRENVAMRRAFFAEVAAKSERARNDQATRSMTQTGTVLLKRGDVEAAEMWLLEALAMRRASPDAGDSQVVEILSALANLRHWQRDFAEAERLARESVAIRRQLQQDDPALARTLNFLADSRYELGDLPDAERLFREGLAIMRCNGTNDPGTLQWSLYALAETIERQNRFAEAEPLYRELLAQSGANAPIEDGVLSPGVGFTRCLIELAWLEQQQGKSAEALGHAREAEAILQAGLRNQPEPTGSGAWQLAEMKSRLGGARFVALVADASLQPAMRLSEFAQVETLMLESEKQLREEPSVHPNFKRDACERLVRLYEAWNAAAPVAGKAEKAVEWRQRLVAPKP